MSIRVQAKPGSVSTRRWNLKVSILEQNSDSHELTFMWCTQCEESTVQGMNVRVVLHLQGNRAVDFRKAFDHPPTTCKQKKTHLENKDYVYWHS